MFGAIDMKMLNQASKGFWYNFFDGNCAFQYSTSMQASFCNFFQTNFLDRTNIAYNSFEREITKRGNHNLLNYYVFENFLSFCRHVFQTEGEAARVADVP